MNLIWGIVLIIIVLILCWLAQILNAFSPALAARWRLTEPESDVDPTYYADVHGEAIWDVMILWILPAAGILFLLDNPRWVYFGLVGGGTYLYFSGRMLTVRYVLQRRGISIGKPKTVRLYDVFLTLWGLIALAIIAMAVAVLQRP